MGACQVPVQLGSCQVPVQLDSCQECQWVQLATARGILDAGHMVIDIRVITRAQIASAVATTATIQEAVLHMTLLTLIIAWSLSAMMPGEGA